MHIDLINWLVIPLLIALARTVDVSIGTVRIIFVSRGMEKIAAFLGFFEIIIWLIAITQVMNNLTNVACYIGYGFGFAMGNVIGITIEKKLALGMQIFRIITSNQLETLQMALRDEGYGVTTVDAHGAKTPVKIIYTVCKRKDSPHIMNLINTLDPQCFVTVQDIRSGHLGFAKNKNLFFSKIKKK
ncbi:MAG: DUF2179 domain-containing protein [Spirochaetes bacterium]|nr:DUF2179 domain-containing protein [Spirochaetota bacterium]